MCLVCLLWMTTMYTTAFAQDKYYKELNKITTTDGEKYCTRYIRLYGDSGYVVTDLYRLKNDDAAPADTVIIKGFYRKSGPFFQFVAPVAGNKEPEIKFCLKRSGNKKFYYTHPSGGYEFGWFTWMLTRGKPLKRFYPDAAMQNWLRG